MRLDELTGSSLEEKELAELLTVLIDEYETRRYPLPKAIFSRGRGAIYLGHGRRDPFYEMV
jgi:hypothetical protein